MAQTLAPTEIVPHDLITVLGLTTDGRGQVARNHGERCGVASRMVQRAEKEIGKPIAHVVRRASLRTPPRSAAGVARAEEAVVIEDEVWMHHRRPAKHRRL